MLYRLFYLEICNPLGSKKSIHKIDMYMYMHVYCTCDYIILCLGVFYYVLGILHPKFRSQVCNIQLAAIVKCNGCNSQTHYWWCNKTGEVICTQYRLCCIIYCTCTYVYLGERFTHSYSMANVQPFLAQYQQTTPQVVPLVALRKVHQHTECAGRVWQHILTQLRR